VVADLYGIEIDLSKDAALVSIMSILVFDSIFNGIIMIVLSYADVICTIDKLLKLINFFN